MVPGAAALGAEAVLQWWASGRNYAKYSPEGANPVAIIKVRFGLTKCVGHMTHLSSGPHMSFGSSFYCWPLIKLLTTCVQTHLRPLHAR